MKKSMLFIALFGLPVLFFSDAAGAVTTVLISINPEQAGIVVPLIVKNKFAKDYPEAVVSGWRNEGENFKVMFNDKNINQVIVYDKEAKVIRKETALDVINVPPSINEYYKINYPGEPDYKVWKIESKEGVTTYSSPVKDRMIYFDSQGKYTRWEDNAADSWNEIKDQKPIRKK